VRRAGLRFAFIRVADGSTLTDSRFAENWRGARRAGLLRGAYQYFRPDESAIAQADLVIRALARDPGELPPVIDVENTGGKAPHQIVERVGVWVDRVRDKLGVEPIVYTGPDFWTYRAGGADMTRQPLWIAHYTPTCPTIPPRWRTWTFWQHTDNGRVPGIDMAVDLDVFAGSMRELQEFARRHGPRPR
jgi:lysozyme